MKRTAVGGGAVKIGETVLGPGRSCYVIAEAGLNHNGDLELAKRLVDLSVVCGADAVKFQKRTVAQLATRDVLDAQDERFPDFGTTYRALREHLEFDEDEYRDLIAYCAERRCTFLCTAFDIPAADLLERLGVPAFKVASHSVSNLPLLEHLASIGKPVLMSTGMCVLDEIDDAASVFLDRNVPLALLHCVSAYPQPAEDSNLRMIDLLRDRYGVPVGYSGHELGYLPTLAAVAIGADLVERHVTLDRTMVGLDHKLSLEADELRSMIRDIRTIERARGDGVKQVSDREKVTRDKYHVSIVSACEIPEGAEITREMLTLKNPGTGLRAKQIQDVVNRRARTTIPADALITWEMLA